MQNSDQRFGVQLLQALLIFAIIGVAHATPSISDGSRLYAPCGVCHQPKAWGSPDGTIPSLAGQQKRYLEKQFALFSNGARVDAAMQVVTAHPILGNSNDIRVLASYLSGLDANQNPVRGSGKHLRVGQELYTHICAACHGVGGGGEPGNRVPRIAGQHFPYLSQQIEAGASLHKDLAPPEMISALRGMRPQEKEALADYISRLGTSDALLDSSRGSDEGRGQPPGPPG